MSLFLSIVFWALIGASTSYLASQRGRNPYAWFFVGILFGVLGTIALFVLPSLTPVEEKEKTTEVPMSEGSSNGKNVISGEWFCLDTMRKQLGPMSVNDLKILWAEGKIDRNSYVWCGGMGDWQHIFEISDLHKTLE